MGLDHTIDETTWPSASYSDMHNRVQGKKCTKGGQHVLLLDAQRRYIYGWTPRHNLWPVEKPFTASGPAEVKRLVEMVLPLVIETPHTVHTLSTSSLYIYKVFEHLQQWLQVIRV